MLLRQETPLRHDRARRGALLGFLTAAVTAAALAVPAPAAQAAITNQTLSGTAGATKITLLGGAVESGLTAASTLTTASTGVTRANATASVAVGGVVTADAVHTRVVTTAISGGKKVEATSHVANLNLLGGLVRADAVDTTSTVKVVNGIATPSGATQFVGLHVAGVTLPVTIPKNFTVRVGDIAAVTLNYTAGTQLSDATARHVAAGIKVTLLGEAGTTPAGSTVLVTPAQAAATTPAQPVGAAIGGEGYSTQVLADVLGAVKVTSDKTALAVMPRGGTAGRTVTNSTVGIDLPGVLKAGVLTNSVNGSRTPEASRSTVTAEAVGLNLLGGLITADAIYGKARAAKVSGGTPQLTAQSTFVNLTIAGRAIPVNVAANTSVNVLGLVKVTLNKQVRTATGVTVRGLQVDVVGAGLGLPVGARIIVANANAWVVSAG